MDTNNFREFFWGAVVPLAFPHVRSYPKDLLCYDRDIMWTHPQMYFVLGVGPAGTNLISIVDFCRMPPLEQKYAFVGATARFIVCPAANWICPIL